MSFLAKLRHPSQYLIRNNSFKNITNQEYSTDYFHSVRCRVIVIVGGKNPPTLDLAENFADAGARAIILGTPRNEEFFQATDKLNSKYGEDKIIVEPCDITNKLSITQLFKLATKLFGSIDIVVNSADLDGHIDQTISMNIKSVILSTLSGFNYMGSNSCGTGGTIINICSIFGLEPFFGSPVYSGAKHFVIGFTRSLGSNYFYKLTKVKLVTVCVGATNINTVPKSDSNIPGFDCLNYDKMKYLEKKPLYTGKEFRNCLFAVLDDGDNGSVWIVEGGEFYKANFPYRTAVRIPNPIC